MSRPKCLIVMPLPYEPASREIPRYLHIGGDRLENLSHIYALTHIKNYNDLRDQLDVAVRALVEYSMFNPADRVIAENALRLIHEMQAAEG